MESSKSSYKTLSSFFILFLCSLTFVSCTKKKPPKTTAQPAIEALDLKKVEENKKLLSQSQQVVTQALTQDIPVFDPKQNSQTLILRFKIDKGYHIQANPASFDYLIPTTLTLKDNPAYKIKKIIYPKGKPHFLKESKENISTYDHQISIAVEVEPLKHRHEKPYFMVQGSLRYQACNDHNCLFPIDFSFEEQYNYAPNK